MKQISLYEALEKVKLINSKINLQSMNSNISSELKSEWLVKFANSDKLITQFTLNDVTAKIQSCYDSRIKLLDNLAILKCAIANANSKTIVCINGRNYTITEAITKKNMLTVMRRSYTSILNIVNRALYDIDTHNMKVLNPDNEADYLNKIVGNMQKNVGAEYETLKDLYRKNNEWALYDPLNLAKVIPEKLEELDAFEQEVNFKLNQANVQTLIEVPDDI